MGFRSDVAEKALVACGRHCCICKKFCSFKIELHHIIQKADNGVDSFENCIPLCFDCHADVKAYNPKHPKGRRFTESELRAHRDGWYQKVREQHTAIPLSATFALKENSRDGSNVMWFESINNIRDEIFKETEINSQKQVEENTHTAKEKENNDSADYIFTDTNMFRKEEISLEEKITLLNEEKKAADDLGFKSSVKEVEANIVLTESQLEMLRMRMMIIEKGYEYWDKIDFQIACEACCLFDYWHCIGVIDNGRFNARQDIVLRIPPTALRKLKLAIGSGLFHSFIICEAIDPSDEYYDNSSGPNECLSTTIDYYLFGSPCDDESHENAELFLVDNWNLRDL